MKYRTLDTYPADLRNEDPPRREDVTEIQDKESGELLCYANPEKTLEILQGCEPRTALYLMVVSGHTFPTERHWVDAHRAGALYDSGWIRVDFGGLVIGADGKERPITEDEKKMISDIADEYSGSK